MTREFIEYQKLYNKCQAECANSCIEDAESAINGQNFSNNSLISDDINNLTNLEPSSLNSSQASTDAQFDQMDNYLIYLIASITALFFFFHLCNAILNANVRCYKNFSNKLERKFRSSCRNGTMESDVESAQASLEMQEMLNRGNQLFSNSEIDNERISASRSISPYSGGSPRPERCLTAFTTKEYHSVSPTMEETQEGESVGIPSSASSFSHRNKMGVIKEEAEHIYAVPIMRGKKNNSDLDCQNVVIFQNGDYANIRSI